MCIRDSTSPPSSDRAPPSLTPQAWLEFAKMEEERGHFSRCQQILNAGLHHCPLHEALMLKAIKHHERMGNLGGARSLLGLLRSCRCACGTPRPGIYACVSCWRTAVRPVAIYTIYRVRAVSYTHLTLPTKRIV